MRRTPVKLRTREPVRLEQEEQPQEQMCCEGGMTAEEHRKQSPDGKCCTDD